LSPEDQQLRAEILNGYRAILDKPFQPHVVARNASSRLPILRRDEVSGQLGCVGDDLFQQDTIESINEATQLYVLSANLLGPRPQRIPPRGMVQPKTFAQLKARVSTRWATHWSSLKASFHSIWERRILGQYRRESAGALFGIGRTLYFCIPRNEKLLGYWNTVADRLFKIRHCNEHPGRGASVGAVRAADRSRHAGQGHGGWARSQKLGERLDPADRPGPLSDIDPKGAGALCRGGAA